MTNPIDTQIPDLNRPGVGTVHLGQEDIAALALDQSPGRAGIACALDKIPLPMPLLEPAP